MAAVKAFDRQLAAPGVGELKVSARDSLATKWVTPLATLITCAPIGLVRGSAGVCAPDPLPLGGIPVIPPLVLPPKPVVVPPLPPPLIGSLLLPEGLLVLESAVPGVGMGVGIGAGIGVGAGAGPTSRAAPALASL